jgi:amino acid transporter
MSTRFRRLLFGPPKNVRDPEALHNLSLVALLAWVGLGADGLSSSAYGPEETFRALGEHTGLAFFLALATAATVSIISFGYIRIIEQFPTGGGGYVVASRLLHAKVGLVSGAALLVDYILTIAISIASGADAIFSFLPPRWHHWKLPVAFLGMGVLTVMNIRGVKESVKPLVPIFMVFLLTHVILLFVAIGGHAGDLIGVSQEVRQSVARTTGALGAFGALKLLVHAYSLGGGTYTGIEAVSNGVGMMREPRVQTAKRTMLLMAASLAITASGLLLSYLLVHVEPENGKTMNAVLLERVAGHWTVSGFEFGGGFVIAALLSEGALLFIAAQAGFVDGPRVMANMALDSWLPHRFAALSDRLSMHNGVIIMGGAAVVAMLYTRGHVSKLVIMYSINVFMTFSLSNLGMARYWILHRTSHRNWLRNSVVHVLALVLCATILIVTTLEKFGEGGWVTLVVTSLLVTLCFAIRRHYRRVVAALKQLDVDLPSPPEVEAFTQPEPNSALLSFQAAGTSGLLEHRSSRDPDRDAPVAILLVGGYSGLGRHALLTLMRMFPHHFQGVIFVSVAVMDSESFKGPDQVGALEKRTRESLLRYERYAHTLGLRASSALAVGTEVPTEAENIAGDLITRYPNALFVAGQIIFEDDALWNRVLHNETAFMVQKRLQRRGIPMIVVPVRVDLKARRIVPAPALAH